MARTAPPRPAPAGHDACAPAGPPGAARQATRPKRKPSHIRHTRRADRTRDTGERGEADTASSGRRVPGSRESAISPYLRVLRQSRRPRRRRSGAVLPHGSSVPADASVCTVPPWRRKHPRNINVIATISV